MAEKQLIVFNLGEEEFGVEVTKLKEIIKPPRIVSVPDTPAFIEGIINLRGEVHPIFNLRKKFGFVEKPFDENTKILIVNVNDNKVGVVVDEVSEIIRLNDDDIEKTPEMVSKVSGEYISGVGKKDDRMVIMLNLDIVLGM